MGVIAACFHTMNEDLKLHTFQKKNDVLLMVLEKFVIGYRLGRVYIYIFSIVLNF